MSFMRRCHATLLVLSRLRRERRVPYLEPDRIAALRDARVRATVGHAAAFVPYYRELFNRERLDPREIRTAHDLARLPLVAKADLQQDPASFVSEHPAARAGIRLRTSGSTGMPLDVWHDRESLLANIAFAERERELEARLAGSRLSYTVLELGHRSTPGIPIDAFYSRETLRPFRPALARMLVSEPLERVVDALNRLRPDVVRGYGTYLEALFRKIDASSIDVWLPKVIAFSSDTMTPEGMALIQQRFGIPVLGRYGAIEALKIGYTCEAGVGYHLNEDLCHVRIVDDEVVLSNLVNRGTILLNYRLGDIASRLEEPCPCGRSFRRLDGLVGRSSAVLELRDGRLVHSLTIWGAVLRDYPALLRYQLVQHEPALFELKLVTRDARAFDGIAASAVPRLRDLLGGVEIEATRHDVLEVANGAKFQALVPLRG